METPGARLRRWRNAVCGPDSPLTPVQRFVADVISHHFNTKQGFTCYLSYGRIAACTGYSVRTVERAVPVIVERGFLHMVQGGIRNGVRLASTYTMRFPTTDRLSVKPRDDCRHAVGRLPTGCRTTTDTVSAQLGIELEKELEDRVPHENQPLDDRPLHVIQAERDAIDKLLNGVSAARAL